MSQYSNKFKMKKTKITTLNLRISKITQKRNQLLSAFLLKTPLSHLNFHHIITITKTKKV